MQVCGKAFLGLCEVHPRALHVDTNILYRYNVYSNSLKTVCVVARMLQHCWFGVRLRCGRGEGPGAIAVFAAPTGI